MRINWPTSRHSLMPLALFFSASTFARASCFSCSRFFACCAAKAFAWAPLRGILVVCVYRYASAPLAWAAQLAAPSSWGVSLPIDTRRTARLARSTASRGGCLARVPRSGPGTQGRFGRRCQAWGARPGRAAGGATSRVVGDALLRRSMRGLAAEDNVRAAGGLDFSQIAGARAHCEAPRT